MVGKFYCYSKLFIVKIGNLKKTRYLIVNIFFQDSSNTLIIRNGKVVNENEITDQDVYIENGIIKQLGTNISVKDGVCVIDAKGMFVMPGGIDPHTHFEMEFMGTKTIDDFYHGTKAAVAGGTTMISKFYHIYTYNLELYLYIRGLLNKSLEKDKQSNFC